MPPKLPSEKPERIVRALEKCGFVRSRQRGSHLTLAHPESGRQVTVSMHRKELYPVAIRRIVEQSGLSFEEFLEAL